MTGRGRTRCGRALAAVVCASSAAALAGGCAAEDPDKGTNKVGKLSAAKIEKKARKAADSARSVKLSGDVVTRGKEYTLDLRLKRTGGTGKVSAKGGNTFVLLRKEKDLYLKADVNFWADQEKNGRKPSRADIEAAGKLEGKYVKVPHGDPAYKQLSGFTDMDTMLDGLLTLDGTRTKGKRDRIDGKQTVAVEAGKGGGGILAVSLNGRPFPLRLERGGSAGTVRMSDWNEDFALDTPDRGRTVDYGKKISASD